MRRAAIGRRVQREAAARQRDDAEGRHNEALECVEAGAEARPPPAGTVRSGSRWPMSRAPGRTSAGSAAGAW
eukprot:8282778-Alexandrium_andersonii.AAC.1